MSGSVAEFEIPAEEFALYETLTTVEGVEFEIERIVAHESERVMPFVWASGAEVEEIEAALENDPSIERLELLAGLGDEQLYRMEWVDHIKTLIRMLVEENATILAASGRKTTWHLRALFPERDALSRTHEYCKEEGLTIDIKSIYRLDEGRQGRFGLTDKQHDTLVEAFEQGYYEIPRGVTAEELGAALGVSHQALSEQLRRAHGSLVENTIVIGHGTGTDEE